MPTDKDFKRLVRQRMAETGERYTDARAGLTSGDRRTYRGTAVASTPRSRWIGWIELLAHPTENQEAFRLLESLPSDELRPLAIAATRHDDPKIRRRGCRLLDDLALTDESIAALQACAEDADPRVREAAFHTLSCERCKPDGVCLDPRAIAERAANDKSAKVRRGVAMTLVWDVNFSDDWSFAMAKRFLDDASAKTRQYALAAVDRIERQRRTDAARRELPEPLRTKTERHPNKWVAIEGGRIVAVDPPPSWRRRHPDANLYFVIPNTQGTEGT